MLLWRLTQSQLVENAGHMPLHSSNRDHEFFSHTGIGAPFGDQRQNLPLAFGQPIERAVATGTADKPGDHIRIER